MGRILLTFIRKEWIQSMRDPRMRFILFGAPLIQVIIFGYVVTTDIHNISLLVQDYDRSSVSRTLAASFFATKYFVRPVTETVNVELAMRRGSARACLVIPAGFNRQINRGEVGTAQILIDGTDGNSALIIKGYVEEIMNRFILEQMFVRLNRHHPEIQSWIRSWPLVRPQIRVLYNPELVSAHFMVPGLLCIILLISTALLSGMSIAREKETGTMEQILVSPLAQWQFILGKTIPYVIIGFIDLGVLLIASRILFHIPFRGSMVLLLLAAVIFLFSSLGLGLFGASVSGNQAQVLLSIFPFFMPSFLLSGLVFPVASIPLLFRWIAYINPMTYFLKIVRGILLKDAGLNALGLDYLMLALFGAALITFSSLRFRKRLE